MSETREMGMNVDIMFTPIKTVRVKEGEVLHIITEEFGAGFFLSYNHDGREVVEIVTHGLGHRADVLYSEEIDRG